MHLLSVRGEPTLVALAVIFVVHSTVGYIWALRAFLPNTPFGGRWVLAYRVLVLAIVGFLLGSAAVMFVKTVLWAVAENIYRTFVPKRILGWFTLLFVVCLAEWAKLGLATIARRALFLPDENRIAELRADGLKSDQYGFVYEFLTGWMVGGGAALGLIAFGNRDFTALRYALLFAFMHGSFTAYLMRAEVRGGIMEGIIYGDGIGDDDFIGQNIKFVKEMWIALCELFKTPWGWVRAFGYLLFLVVLGPVITMIVLPALAGYFLVGFMLDVSLASLAASAAEKAGLGWYLGCCIGLVFVTMRLAEGWGKSK